MPWTTIIVSSTSGAIAAIITSIIAPWVKWHLEKKKLQHQRKKEIIDELRKLCSQNNIGRGDIINASHYCAVRDGLKEKTRKDLERPTNELHCNLNSAFFDADVSAFLDDLAMIEEQWGIK